MDIIVLCLQCIVGRYGVAELRWLHQVLRSTAMRIEATPATASNDHQDRHIDLLSANGCVSACAYSQWPGTNEPPFMADGKGKCREKSVCFCSEWETKVKQIIWLQWYMQVCYCCRCYLFTYVSPHQSRLLLATLGGWWPLHLLHARRIASNACRSLSAKTNNVLRWNGIQSAYCLLLLLILLWQYQQYRRKIFRHIIITIS